MPELLIVVTFQVIVVSRYFTNKVCNNMTPCVLHNLHICTSFFIVVIVCIQGQDSRGLGIIRCMGYTWTVWYREYRHASRF